MKLRDLIKEASIPNPDEKLREIERILIERGAHDEIIMELIDDYGQEKFEQGADDYPPRYDQ